MYPPTDAELQLIAQDIMNEIKKCQANPLQNHRWSGGTIPSNFKHYYADVDREGKFSKVFYNDGNRKEFFAIK